MGHPDMRKRRKFARAESVNEMNSEISIRFKASQEAVRTDLLQLNIGAGKEDSRCVLRVSVVKIGFNCVRLQLSSSLQNSADSLSLPRHAS